MSITVESLLLTDAEREAVRFCSELASMGDRPDLAATLRGLLGRHFPVPENSPSQDNKPDTHTNHDEGSVLPECAVSSARLAALEKLSAADQELELKYGLIGNPMIKQH